MFRGIPASDSNASSSAAPRGSGRLLDRMPPADYASAEEIEDVPSSGTTSPWPTPRIDQRFREIRAQLVDANARELMRSCSSYFSDIAYEEKGVASSASGLAANNQHQELVDDGATGGHLAPAVREEEDSADAIRRLYQTVAVSQPQQRPTAKYHGLVPSPRVGVMPPAAQQPLTVSQPTTSKGPIRAISSPPQSSASGAAESVRSARNIPSSSAGDQAQGSNRNESSELDEEENYSVETDDVSTLEQKESRQQHPASYRTSGHDRHPHKGSGIDNRKKKARKQRDDAPRTRGGDDDDDGAEVVETLYSVSLVTGKSIDELRAVNPHIAHVDPHDPLPVGTKLKICRKKSNLSPERNTAPVSSSARSHPSVDAYPRLSQHVRAGRGAQRSIHPATSDRTGVSVRQIAHILSLPVIAIWRKVPHFRAYNEDDAIDRADLDGVVIDGVPLDDYLDSPALAPARLAAIQQKALETRSLEDEREEQIRCFVHRHPSRAKTMVVDERDRHSLRSIALSIARCPVAALKDLNPELANLFQVDDILPHATPVWIPADARITYRTNEPTEMSQDNRNKPTSSSMESPAGVPSMSTNPNMFADVMQRRSASSKPVTEPGTPTEPENGPEDDESSSVDPLLFVTPGQTMGQSLSEIAWSLGITVDEIREENPFTFQYSSHAALPTTCRIKLPKSLLWESEPLVSPAPEKRNPYSKTGGALDAGRYRRSTPSSQRPPAPTALASTQPPAPPPPSPALLPAPTGALMPPNDLRRASTDAGPQQLKSSSSVGEQRSRSGRIALVSYTTKRGDTIQRIAKDFSIHPDVVYEHNSTALLLGPDGIIHYQDALAPGQQLLLPDLSL